MYIYWPKESFKNKFSFKTPNVLYLSADDDCEVLLFYKEWYFKLDQAENMAAMENFCFW
jgi:hypothetical protein